MPLALAPCPVTAQCALEVRTEAAKKTGKTAYWSGASSHLAPAIARPAEEKADALTVANGRLVLPFHVRRGDRMTLVFTVWDADLSHHTADVFLGTPWCGWWCGVGACKWPCMVRCRAVGGVRMRVYMDVNVAPGSTYLCVHICACVHTRVSVKCCFVTREFDHLADTTELHTSCNIR